MPDKPSAIFKRLDQFNKRPGVQDRQPKQADAEVEQKPALRGGETEVETAEQGKQGIQGNEGPGGETGAGTAELEKADQSASPIEVLESQPVREEIQSPETTKEDFSTKAEHPPPEQSAEISAGPIRPAESAKRTRPKTAQAPRPISQKKREVASRAPSANASAAPILDDLVRKWKEEFRVHSGEIKVLRALYNLTHGVGSNECVTTQEKLAEAANLQRRQCINNVNTLEKMGFIERVEVYNEKGQRGIKLRFNLTPKPRSA